MLYTAEVAFGISEKKYKRRKQTTVEGRAVRAIGFRGVMDLREVRWLDAAILKAI